MQRHSRGERLLGALLLSLFTVVLVFFLVHEQRDVRELLAAGQLVDATVVRVDAVGRKQAPIFRFVANGRTIEYGHPIVGGDDYLAGDHIRYHYYAADPSRSRPATFLRLYGVSLMLSFMILTVGTTAIAFLVGQERRLTSYPLKLTSLVGAIGFTIAVFLFANYTRSQTNRLLEGGVRTEATVIRIETKTRNNSGERREVYYPIFELTDLRGQRREYRQRWSGRRGLQVGSQVAYIYHPDHLKLGRRADFWHLWGTTIALTGMGAIMLVGIMVSWRRL